MDFGTIIWLLIIIGFVLYRKAKKDAEKQKPVPMDGQRRKDEDFSLEEILRKIQEAQNPQQRTASPRKAELNKEQDERLPFEKRKALERTFERPANTREAIVRESIRPVVDYDDIAIDKLNHPKSKTGSKQREASRIDFHFSEKDQESTAVREWLDLRKAIIGAEILRRPEY